MTDTPAIAEGRVARVVGPVVDVEFPPDRIPPLYNALTVEVNLAGQGEGEAPPSPTRVPPSPFPSVT